ncbi:MAG: response regulator [Balneolaceae bacterium]
MSTKNFVCIIDDDKVYSYGIKKIIRRHNLGDSILLFENGKEALQAFTLMVESGEELPDLILLDIDMPVMNGWEFLAEFESLRKKVEKKIDIYVISSTLDQAGELYKLEHAGNVADFISKPVKTEDLKKIAD